MNIDELRKKAADLPLNPGVYLMKNQNKEVIYVGKAEFQAIFRTLRGILRK